MNVEIVFEDNEHVYRVPLRQLLRSLGIELTEGDLKRAVLDEVYKT